MNRFEVINGSKFERLSYTEMAQTKGGQFCISCMKRGRAIRIGWKTQEELRQENIPTSFPMR